MTLFEVYREGVHLLSQNGIDSPDFDAMCLLEDSFSLSKAKYYSVKDNPAHPERAHIFFEKIKRRCNKEPLQYILGRWGFFEFDFFVGEGLLIPRPETACLVERAVEEIKKKHYQVCFDLCAGSGCVGLSIAAKCPECRVVLLEKYDRALEYLFKNNDYFALENVNILKYDILNPFNEDLMPFPDIIISNPPYIASDEIPLLQDEVQREPLTALDGGADGLDFYRAIHENWVQKIPELKEVIFECGENQSAEIGKIYEKDANASVEFFSDMFGIQRFVQIKYFNTQKGMTAK